MKSIALFLSLLAAISFYGCAAGIHGTTQTVPVVTDPPGAAAKATNGQASLPQCNLTLQADTGHVVTISKTGYESESRQLNSMPAGAETDNTGRGVDTASERKTDWYLKYCTCSWVIPGGGECGNSPQGPIDRD